MRALFRYLGKMVKPQPIILPFLLINLFLRRSKSISCPGLRMAGLVSKDGDWVDMVGILFFEKWKVSQIYVASRV